MRQITARPKPRRKTMTKLNRTIITIAAATTAILPAALAQSTLPPPECNSTVSVQMQAVALAAPRNTPLVNFSGSGGQLDPVPLLQTSFNVFGVPGRPVCVALTYSAQIDPTDNYGVYPA